MVDLMEDRTKKRVNVEEEDDDNEEDSGPKSVEELLDSLHSTPI
jgi:hypothetical protein